MTTENDVKDIPETKENPLTSITKKEKNPKRVAAGKKGVEARKIKAEFKRKEAELLKKENLELKDARRQITRDEDQPMFKDEEITIVKQNSDKNSNYISNNNILFLSMGIIGLGLYFLKLRKRVDNTSENTNDVNVVRQDTKKKEIDPFEFN